MHCARRLGLPLALSGLLIGTAAHGTSPVRLVNVHAGTAEGAPDFGTGGGAGNTFPGATAPFGMLQWSPDTHPGRTNSPGGYSWEDTEIRGFSLTHLSGAGCPCLQDVPFLPTTVPIVASPAEPGSYLVASDLRATFRHEDERAEPGSYRVVLNRDRKAPIRVELAATTRAGLGRFTFPRTETASLLVNLGGSAMANGEAAVAIDPAAGEVSGSVESGQFCYHRNRYTVYFVAEFDRPFDGYGTWTEQTLAPGGVVAGDVSGKPNPVHFRPIAGILDPPPNSDGAQAGAYVTFDTRRGRTVQMRVAISFVSVENARANLRAEASTWKIGEVRRGTRRAWNDLLGLVRVRGGSRADLRTFYTMLYHAFLAPTVFGDVTGEYMGMDGQVRRAEGFTPYTTFSGWDVYRSQMPLLAMLVPDRTSDMMQSLVMNAAESGWLPRWSVVAGHTDVMVGDPAAAIIAGADAFGARDFDRSAALAALVKGGTQTGTSANAEYVERQALADYLANGWVPHDGTEGSSGASTSIFGSTDAVWGSAATTLEYATADFAVARLAARLGEDATCATFAARADGWRHLLDPTTGWLTPRFGDGSFLTPFDPASGEGWVEGSGAQYAWMVPHDVAGLVDAFGGPADATARLDEFFTELNAGPTSRFAFLGNEPCAHTPWLWAWLGRPSRTQGIVREAMLGLFGATPEGYPGNDDLGQMSAWYVFAALGIYPAVPGTDVLVLGSPLFRKATLRLAEGTLVLAARKAARSRPYVSRLRVDGDEHARPWIRFADLCAGGRIDFDLTSNPVESWGGNAADAPPSFGPGRADACVDMLP